MIPKYAIGQNVYIAKITHGLDFKVGDEVRVGDITANDSSEAYYLVTMANVTNRPRRSRLKGYIFESDLSDLFAY